MLSTAAPRWPAGAGWALQPKWDGFRLLIELREDGRARAWSRHGVDLSARIGGLPAVFEAAGRGSLFDGELVAVGGSEERAVQDFATVCRAVLHGDRTAADRLQFVAFDVLELASENLRHRRWDDRDQLVADALPQSPLVRRVDSLAATKANHDALLALGFEGSVLKRRNSIYRPGRSRGWLKHKARHTANAVLVGVRQDREGHWHAICDTDGRKVAVLASASTADRVGEVVRLAYSRVDADGGLREPRLEAPPPRLEAPPLDPAGRTQARPATAA
jgi:bifunctional non-homologous end joining protein LigD